MSIDVWKVSTNLKKIDLNQAVIYEEKTYVGTVLPFSSYFFIRDFKIIV